MTREEFEEVVSRALEDLPQEIQQAMENVAVVVRNWPTRQQLHGNDVRSRYHLLGLYEGVPQTERVQWWMVWMYSWFPAVLYVASGLTLMRFEFSQADLDRAQRDVGRTGSTEPNIG